MLQNLTLRSNITFNNEFDEVEYSNVIEACALAADLNVLPGGGLINRVFRLEIENIL